MRNDPKLRRTIQLGAAAAAVWLVSSGAASTPAAVVPVAVFADHYVLAGRSYDDLDALEDAIAAMHARGVRLEACGENTARAQLSAAHRFRNLYLDLRASGADQAACQPAFVARAVPAGQRFGLKPYGINDEAVGRWWSAVSMP
jgi:hypothetical protein